MSSTYSQTFATPPSLWALYPRILAARKPALVPEGARVPRLEARWSRVQVQPAHLARYRDVCGCAPSGELPIAYPHVLASALHLAILASDRFPVSLLGLVHVANRIDQLGPLEPRGGGELSCWVEGHESTVRGQLFTMHTEWRAAGSVLWHEQSEFLARSPRAARAAPAGSPRPPRGAARGTGERGGASSAAGASAVGSAVAGAGDAGGGAATDGEAGEPGDEATVTRSFRADVGLGRRYGPLAGDLNPIHVADLTARAFGFRAAIAHGMWSLARCAAEVDATVPSAAPRSLVVRFQKPLFLPSAVALRMVREASGTRFAMLDAQAGKPYLSGSLRRVA
jgi:acyl dehydratase